MKHIVIGTAGHVDHGKTRLIQALTGIDTDRLAEEKRRGVTIDLGFAHLRLGDVQAGVIDVPGHERFLKNMLAGAGQTGLALMVVAADEGVMPQTTEHLTLLSLLGVTHGVVAVTKADLVDAGGLALAKQEIAQRFSGSFLQDASVVAVSAKTGAGLDTLRLALEQAALAMPESDAGRPFRMHIDRVFTSNGFGVVTAGVVAAGQVTADDTLCLYPSGQNVRVRGIQVYGTEVQQAAAGQRAALNLARVKNGEVRRGDVLAAPCSVASAMLLDVRLEVLAGGRSISNNQRVHLFIGTDAVLCRITLLGCELLAKGMCYAQLRLENPVAASGGDRFVLRFYSPLVTIGGGVVLAVNPHRHRRGDVRVQADLRTVDCGTPREQVLLMLGGGTVAVREAHAQLWQLTPVQFGDALRALMEDKVLLPLENDYTISAVALEAMQSHALQLLEEYHKANPLARGMPPSQLKNTLFSTAQQPSADAILGLLAAQGCVIKTEGLFACSGFRPALSPEYQAVAQQLRTYYAGRGPVPAPIPKTGLDAGKSIEKTVQLLCAKGDLVRVSPECYLNSEHYAHALQLLRQYLNEHGSITLAQYRDLLGTARKPAQILLEYFDTAGVTRKTGDMRRTTCG